jgi:hypothetical protein
MFDQDLTTATRPNNRPTVCFFIQAAADPSSLPRVLELFAKRGLVPQRCHSDLAGEGGESAMTIDLQIQGLTDQQTAHVSQCLDQMWVVDSVITSHKQFD